jgi:uncharacterized protein with HEPN domain
MKITSTQHLLRQQLYEHVALLDKSLEALRYSETFCAALAGKESYTDEEFEHLEALTARFARTSDILTQKVLKSLFLLLGEDRATFLDATHLAEKLGLVTHADDLMALRTLRNEIAHEYASQNLNEIFSETIMMLPQLHTLAEKVRSYAEEKFTR